MAIDQKILIESIKRNVDKVGSRDVDNYKKELYENVCEVIAQEARNKRSSINILKVIESIIERSGEFLNKD
mgnify:CR=1 FL=1